MNMFVWVLAAAGLPSAAAQAQTEAVPVFEVLADDLVQGNAWVNRGTAGTGLTSINTGGSARKEFRASRSCVSLGSDEAFFEWDFDISHDVRPVLTLEVFVWVDSIPNIRGWLFGDENGFCDRYIILHDSRSGRLGGGTIAGDERVSSSCHARELGGGAIVVGQWNHVVAHYQQGAAEYVWVNGVMSASQSVTHDAGNRRLRLGSPWLVGEAGWMEHYADACVSLARVYTVELSAAQVQANYNTAGAGELQQPSTQPALQVVEGPCIDFVEDGDSCIERSDYGNNEMCTIVVNNPQGLEIEVDYFQTESYDSLTVDFQHYAGTRGPSGEVPMGAITWQTDNSITDRGWKLCLVSPGTSSPSFGSLSTYSGNILEGTSSEDLENANAIGSMVSMLIWVLILSDHGLKGCCLCWACSARPTMLAAAQGGRVPTPPSFCFKYCCGQAAIMLWEGCSGNFWIQCCLASCIGFEWYAACCWNVSALPKVNDRMICVGAPVGVPQVVGQAVVPPVQMAQAVTVRPIAVPTVTATAVPVNVAPMNAWQSMAPPVACEEARK